MGPGSIPRAWSPEILPPRPRAPIRVAGGAHDPASRFVTDVEAVQRAAVAYRNRAEEMRGHVWDLRRIDLDVCLAAIPSASFARRATDARIILGLARTLERHVQARTALAEHTQVAVVLYRDVDAANARAFDLLLDRGVHDLRQPRQNPWVLESAGQCTTTPGTPGTPGNGEDEEYRLPACPQFTWPDLPVENLYGRQELVIDDVWALPTQTAAAAGLAGALQTVHDSYAATSRDGEEEVDTVDVRKRSYVDASGRERESYVVDLAGTSAWDLLDLRRGEEYRSMRPNVEGALGRASAEARLIPEVLERAGIPPGAEVLLVGHSQGGMTAMSAAALPAMRAYRLKVLTAGSPVGRMPVVPGVTYLHLANPGDVVPRAEGVRNRPSRNQVTVTTGKPPHTFDEDHDIGTYVDEAARIDAERAAGVPPSLESTLKEFEEAGHLRREGESDVTTTIRARIRRR